MRIGATFRMALRALRRNKLRSTLTALGIIIGVGAVIAMVGIGNGAKSQVEAQIASLGQNVVLIFPGNFSTSGARSGWGGAGTMTVDDALAGSRQRVELVHHDPRGRTRLSGHSRMAARRWRDVHRPGCARHGQGLRHWQ